MLISIRGLEFLLSSADSAFRILFIPISLCSFRCGHSEGEYGNHKKPNISHLEAICLLLILTRIQPQHQQLASYMNYATYRSGECLTLTEQISSTPPNKHRELGSISLPVFHSMVNSFSIDPLWNVCSNCKVKFSPTTIQIMIFSIPHVFSYYQHPHLLSPCYTFRWRWVWVCLM